jgi:hypothetical protein
VIDFAVPSLQKSAQHGGWWLGEGSGDFRRRLVGQLEPELFDEQGQFGFWLGVAR